MFMDVIYSVEDLEEETSGIFIVEKVSLVCSHDKVKCFAMLAVL